MSLYDETSVEKVESPPLVHDCTHPDHTDDDDGAGGALVALDGAPVEGGVPTYNAGTGKHTSQVPPGAAGGEANTASNVGGEAEVFKQKTGVDLEFRTLKEGANVTITQNADDIEIASTGGSYTDEEAQDAVGAMVDDSANVTLTYTDATPALVADLTATGVAADTYGDATHVPQITVDAKGRITAVTDVAIAGGSAGTPYIDNGDHIADPCNDNFNTAALDTAGTRFSGANAWAWQQQSTSTAVQGSKQLDLAIAGGTTIRHVEEAVPSGATWEVRLELDLSGAFSNDLVGFVLRESGTGRIVTLAIGFSGSWLAAVQYWTNPTTFSSTQLTRGAASFDVLPCALAVECDGTNYLFKVSLHGQGYRTLGSRAMTHHFTTAADKIGIGGYSSGGTPVLHCRQIYRIK